MSIKVSFLKTHPDAKLPKRNNEKDTGYDVFAVEDTIIPPCTITMNDDMHVEWGHPRFIVEVGSGLVQTGITVANVEEGYWFRVEPRSGLGFKSSIQPHLGVIDEPYRGDLAIKLYNFSSKALNVKAGDRIAQVVFYERIDAELTWSDTITETDRGSKGLGSSGN